MTDKLIDDVAALLKRDGFENISKHRSTTSATVSAAKHDQRVVVHLTGVDDAPSFAANAIPNAAANRDLRLKAALPGVKLTAAIETALDATVLQTVRAGAGGGSVARGRK